MRILRYFKPLFLSFDPLIMAYMGMHQENENSRTCKIPVNVKPDIIIEHISWTASEKTLKTIHSRFESYDSKIKRYLVVNTKEEDCLRSKMGVPGFQGNVEIYQPDFTYANKTAYRGESKIKYDAIYNARLDEFKRHSLCLDLENTRFLTGGIGALSGKLNFNEKSSVCYEMLNANEVCDEIQQSNCGLALSAIEGTMRSSTEYLLAGLPVVSTRSIGGRDMFYTSDNSRIVDATPQAIRDGVRYWLKHPPDRRKIRRRVLAQLNTHRYAYSRKISGLQKSSGGNAELPERIFYDLFINPDVVIRRLYEPDSKVTKNELQRSLKYPETVILLKKSGMFSEKYTNTVLTLIGENSAIQLDELSSWIYASLDGQTSANVIINSLASVYGSIDQLADEVRDTLTRFLELGVAVIANQIQ